MARGGQGRLRRRAGLRAAPSAPLSRRDGDAGSRRAPGRDRPGPGGMTTSAPRRCMPRSTSPPCGRWPLRGPRRPCPARRARREPGWRSSAGPTARGRPIVSCRPASCRRPGGGGRTWTESIGASLKELPLYRLGSSVRLPGWSQLPCTPVQPGLPKSLIYRYSRYQIGSECLIMPDTCPGRPTVRRLACSGRGSSVPLKAEDRRFDATLTITTDRWLRPPAAPVRRGARADGSGHQRDVPGSRTRSARRAVRPSSLCGGRRIRLWSR